MNNATNGRRRVIIIAGATASGKSEVAMEIAKHLPVEIVCADSRTVYRGLDIGTAKPTMQDRHQVTHHCIDICEPTETYTAHRYAQDANNSIANIAVGVTPLIVGGSGFYISACVDGLSVTEIDVPEDTRLHLTHEFATRGKVEMYRQLQSVDNAAALLYSDMNPRRVQRALEFYRTTGRPISSTWTMQPRQAIYDAIFILVHREPDELRKRISTRCALMWEQGLLDETASIVQSGVPEQAQALQTVGYKQALDVLHGRKSLKDAQTEMITATWQYAKRQRTWFRKDERYALVSGTIDMCVTNILQLHHERGLCDSR